MLQSQGVLSLYSTGKTIGLVVDSGKEQTRITPVFEGYKIENAMKRMQIGGRDLTNYLLDIHQSLPIQMNLQNLIDTVNQVKEKWWYVAQNFDDEWKKLEDWEISYGLPDGTVVDIGTSWIKWPEILFNSNIINIKYKGVHELIIESIKEWDKETQTNLFRNIVLAGGCAGFEGIKERLWKEVKEGTSNLYQNKIYLNFTKINTFHN